MEMPVKVFLRKYNNISMMITYYLLIMCHTLQFNQSCKIGNVSAPHGKTATFLNPFLSAHIRSHASSGECTRIIPAKRTSSLDKSVITYIFICLLYSIVRREIAASGSYLSLSASQCAL
jgi:hypothetical protein